MIFMIIYLLGWIPSTMLFREIFTRDGQSIWAKLGLCLYVFFFSWIGYFSYVIAIRYFLDRKSRS